MKEISALVFIKKNSERVPNKNFRNFNGKPLYSIILEKLNAIDIFQNIVVDSDSEEILDFVKRKIKRGITIERPKHLTGNHISATELVEYDLNFIKTDYIFQTHCTTPLLTEQTIRNSIEKYFSSLNNFDSLFSVTKMQNRIFDEHTKPLNHSNRKLERTQDMKPIFIENASLFIFSKTSFTKTHNRIGIKPQMFEISPIEGIDIDYEFQFLLAELIEKSENHFPEIF